MSPADELTTLRAQVSEMTGERDRLKRCLLPVWMTMCESELVGEPMPDSFVVLHFMGSGASDQVTAGEVRAALKTASTSQDSGT